MLLSLLGILFFQEAHAREFTEEYQEELQAFEQAVGAAKVVALVDLVMVSGDNYPDEALLYSNKLSELDTAATLDQTLDLGEMRCFAFLFTQDLDSAEQACQQVLQLSLENDRIDFQAAAYNGLASVANAGGKDELAIDLYEQAIAVSPEATLRSAGHSNIGGLYVDRGDYEVAFEHFSSALAELEGEDISEATRCYYSAPAYLSIGDINLRLEEFDTAKEYFQLSVDCAVVAEEAYDHISGLDGLIKVALHAGDTVLADDLSLRSLEISTAKSRVLKAISQTSRAAVLRAQGRVEEALSLARLANEVSENQVLNSGMLDLKLLLVGLNLDSSDNALALEQIRWLESETRSLNRKELVERVLEITPRVLAANEMFAEAYEAQKQYIALSSENLSDRTLQRVAMLQAEVGLSAQQAATQSAQALAESAAREAKQANFLRNAVIAAGFLLLAVGYLFVMRRFQAREIAANAQSKRNLELELELQSKQLKQQSDHALELETQMLHSQKLETIGQLTGGVAHDFNNILVVVLGAIELVRSSQVSTLSDEDQKLLVQASDAIATGSDITQQLLAYSRQQPLEAKPTEILGLLHSISAILSRTLGGRIELDKRFSGDTIWCEIDSAQLTTVVLNLAINARDACEGAGTVALTCEQISTEDCGALTAGEYCLIQMSDNGSGMSPEVVEKITEPFFTTKDSGQGHGLGLSMVYGFVKQSRGDLAVSSELHKGTTVSLWLPICQAPVQPERMTSDARFKPSKPIQTVLVVEDQEEVLEIASRMVSDLGYEVIGATSADQARELMMQGLKPSVVFSDVSMPGELDGVGLARWVSDYAPGIPVLLTSGHPHENISQYSAGFLAKPYRSNDIRTLLEQVA